MCFIHYFHLDSFLSKPGKKMHPFFPGNLEPPNPRGCSIFVLLVLWVAGLSQLVKWTALAAFGLCLGRNPTLLQLGWLKWQCLEDCVWHLWWFKVCFGACFLGWKMHEEIWFRWWEKKERKSIPSVFLHFLLDRPLRLNHLFLMDIWWNSHFFISDEIWNLTKTTLSTVHVSGGQCVQVSFSNE